MLIFLLVILLFYLSIILSLYAIQWSPIYIMAKRYGYSKSWLVFIPIVNKMVMHDIGLGKKERGSFMCWTVCNIIYLYIYMMYLIIFVIDLDVSYVRIHVIANFLLILVILYKMYFTYKFIFKITNIKLVSILGSIPILNILIFWYIVVKY